jgi:hypothetical protein
MRAICDDGNASRALRQGLKIGIRESPTENYFVHLDNVLTRSDEYLVAELLEPRSIYPQLEGA